MKEIWFKFYERFEAEGHSDPASAAEEAVIDWSAGQVDRAYDRWKEEQDGI